MPFTGRFMECVRMALSCKWQAIGEMITVCRVSLFCLSVVCCFRIFPQTTAVFRTIEPGVVAERASRARNRDDFRLNLFAHHCSGSLLTREFYALHGNPSVFS